MDFFDWMKKTSPRERGIGYFERKARQEMRDRVYEKANTSMKYLHVAYFREQIGMKTLQKLMDATATEREEYRITVIKLIK